MEREILEYKEHIAWICICGASNSTTRQGNTCSECKIPRDEYPKKMNCTRCQKVLYDFKKGDTCLGCGRIY